MSGGETSKSGAWGPDEVAKAEERIVRWMQKGEEARARGDYEADRLFQGWCFGAYWVLSDLGLWRVADMAWQGHMRSAELRIKRRKAARGGEA